MIHCQARYFDKALYFSCLLFGAASFAQADPLASNNGMYPDPEHYSGVFNLANLDYPKEPPAQLWTLGGGSGAALTPETAEEYMLELKKHIEPTMRTLVENAQEWDAVEASWYNTVWRGAGSPDDPTSGREAIMNTNTGQIVPSSSWSEPYRPTTESVQNYGVIYYNPHAAYMLGQVWDNIYKPDISKMNFPERSIVVKVEAATIQPNEWPWDGPDTPDSVLQGASEWQVFRPTTEDQKNKPKHEMKNVVQTVYPFQLAIKIKDTVAAPKTGWVFMGFVFDARVEGSVWDKFVPAGAMWGNDPKYANTPNGLPFGKKLEETWINPDAPPFVQDTLGWGGRMAAPMDVAVRHNVVLPSGNRPPEGFRASSCLSCHGTAQFPFTANLYPSPNRFFPRDGVVAFPLYEPGSKRWAEWFKNRPGDEAQSGRYKDVKPLDYDLTTMIALGIRATVSGDDALGFEVINGH